MPGACRASATTGAPCLEARAGSVGGGRRDRRCCLGTGIEGTPAPAAAAAGGGGRGKGGGGGRDSRCRCRRAHRGRLLLDGRGHGPQIEAADGARGSHCATAEVHSRAVAVHKVQARKPPGLVATSELIHADRARVGVNSSIRLHRVDAATALHEVHGPAVAALGSDRAHVHDDRMRLEPPVSRKKGRINRPHHGRELRLQAAPHTG
mmetsp:Transcript_152627/g.489441  ORF Transcript_152627/g.489441 Transcript_152627/m.489441 type:complete len:207 (-) Transcript_152627:274-894(-)